MKKAKLAKTTYNHRRNYYMRSKHEAWELCCKSLFETIDSIQNKTLVTRHICDLRSSVVTNRCTFSHNHPKTQTLHPETIYKKQV